MFDYDANIEILLTSTVPSEVRHYLEVVRTNNGEGHMTMYLGRVPILSGWLINRRRVQEIQCSL